jgi:hypothetical protein
VDRSVVFNGVARVASLPPYLTVQMMRFFFKRTPDGGQKAKILRKVRAELCVLQECCAVAGVGRPFHPFLPPLNPCLS